MEEAEPHGQGKATNMPRGSHGVKGQLKGSWGLHCCPPGQTECQGRVLRWVPSGKAETGEEGGGLAAAALAGCAERKELAGSQGSWPVAGGSAWRLRYKGPGQRRGGWKAGSPG